MSDLAILPGAERSQAVDPWRATPDDLIAQAAAAGNLALVEKLMDLAERRDKAMARRAFDAAISAAKAEIPIIRKNRHVDFTSQKGRTHYRYEDFAEVARTVNPVLGAHGLSYRYRTAQDGTTVTVTCVVSHRDGYSEETVLSAARDDSGNKNNIQAVASTVNYLQRMTLKVALGLAASENDDDGHAAGASDLITMEQVEQLQALADEVGADLPRFCRHMGVAALVNLPAKRFGEAIASLETKRAKVQP